MDASVAGGAERDVGPEVWGGVECTINRIGDRWYSQLERSGHLGRESDLDAFASLGLRALRQPVLWEQVAPGAIDDGDWAPVARRLGRLRSLGIRPIVGLVHHGSGPAHTSLVSACFPGKLAAYAEAVARRHPWVTDYTPVNEPLTTARFSGLYGHWYPHGRDPRVFWQALHGQCKGTVLAMQAIRRVQPEARLVQTDDLGRTWSTPLLAYQAGFNNEMRWLSWDLLCGNVDPGHPLWDWLLHCCGAREGELHWFCAHPCPPDVIGINHYVTSNRFLDERLERYPAGTHGGNGRHAYADVEAVRVLDGHATGAGPLLREGWERYRRPMALTEVHLHAPREDQLRWLWGAWQAACGARAEGVDVRALTVWALLGSYDWDSLLTKRRGHYESGAFEVRRGLVRPTGVALLTRHLARRTGQAHPVLSGRGWWQRPARLAYTRVESGASPSIPPATSANARPLLITGATGTLGRAFARICAERGIAHRLLDRAAMDIADPASVQWALARCQPWAVINTAGYVRVDDAERDRERCFRENTEGAAVLAGRCEQAGVALLTFSTDLVFDGTGAQPYLEDAAVAPINVYGESKARAEKLVLERHPDALVVRTSAFFGPWDRYNFIACVLGALRQGAPFHAATDVTISPTYVPDLVHACLDLLVDGESGVWHLTNGEPVTWAELALRAANAGTVDAGALRPCSSARLGWAARRPRYSALGSAKAFAMPKLDDALARFVRDHPAGG